MKKIFIITGELSGDIHASNLVKNLKSQNSDLIIEGVGAENLANQDVKLFCDHSKMSAVGLSLSMIIDHLFLGKRIIDYLENNFLPDLVILVDYGGFNLNLSKILKKKGFKIFYYIPPQIWASRKWRLKTVKANIDKVLTIFPFENQMYEKIGVDCEFVGHPLVSQLPLKADKITFFEKYNLDKNKKLVSIFPGSRVFELKNLMRIFINSAKKIKKAYPDVQFVISHAPNLPDDIFELYCPNEIDIKVIKGDNHALLSVSDALILASGTVALEASLYQTPMIIAYKGPWLFYLVYLLVRSIKKVSLPNIITNKNIVPELLMAQANSKLISKKIIEILKDENIKNKYINDLSIVSTFLTDKNSALEASKIILRELN